MKTTILIVFFTFLFYGVNGQNIQPEIKGDSIIYHLDIHYKKVNFSGNEKTAIAINNSIPAPTLEFEEGKIAVIHVHNSMDEETSVHWHGLILPNLQDGVPYLTTPPILPGNTFTYSFPLRQSGTYWYHSHTGLQEQLGLYGGIIIHPKNNILKYDKDLVLVLSDWTDTKPHNVLKNLKRHNEWYGVKIGNAPSVFDAITNKTLGAQFRLWANQMPGMHISDIYYEAFLINGKKVQLYNNYKTGEKLRLRVINASASTYFWLTLANQNLKIVSADGIDVQAVETEKVLIGIAETYDFIVEIEDKTSLEFRATAQDVTGYTSAYLGSGTAVLAPSIPFPNYQLMGEKMARMHDGEMNSMMLNADEKGTIKPAKSKETKMDGMKHKNMHQMDIREPMLMWDAGYNNSILKSKEPTQFKADSVRHFTLNLTGNMWRYIWDINGKPLSKADKIKFNKGEIVQVTLNNTTMMHHPMHLHGHFFRVLNGNGDYSPLKHTVDLPPMSRTTIEFIANEDKDWFFHCHVLYHMMSGMARVYSYNNSVRNDELKPFPVSNLLNHDKEWFFWGTLSALSNLGKMELITSNTFNQVNFKAEYGWQQETYEIKADYERFLGSYFRVYGGVKAETEEAEDFDNPHISYRIGARYLLLYILDTDFSVDHKLRPELAFEAHLPLTKRLMLAGHFEWKSDFGIVTDLPGTSNYDSEIVWNTNLEYIIGKNFLITAGYDNRFNWGAGLKMLF
jgi:FtsP/CotA-like multicopper oxidase with cupredoxin domain